jgi:uncharacterized protein YjbJ (UPF0337 family)
MVEIVATVRPVGREQTKRRCGRKLNLHPHAIYRMNTLPTSASWKEIKAKLKQRYPDLTDEDLTFSDGKEEALLARLQKRLGKSSEELRQMIRDL